MERDPTQIAQTLTAMSQSPDRAAAAAELLPLVYDELRVLARKYLRGERGGHTLQPTALVHEAFMRLVDQTSIDWKGRTHFLAVSAQAMRRVLIDHARGRGRRKRGGDWERVVLDDVVAPDGLENVDALALNDVLEELAALDEFQARIVELRFFGGLTVEEAALVLGTSKRKVEGEWTHAKAWLRARLSTESRP